MNFNISATTDHLQAVRNFASSGHVINNRNLLDIVYDSLKVPYDSFMKEIVGMRCYDLLGSDVLREFVKFGLFHTAPDYQLLTGGIIHGISSRVLAKAYPDKITGVQQTFLDGDQITIYYQELASMNGYYSSKDFAPGVQTMRPMVQTPYQHFQTYKSPSASAIETALVELVGSADPVIKIGDLNCYTVTKSALDAAVAKRVVTQGVVGDYVELRKTLRHLCVDLESLQINTRLGKTLGEICNLIAGEYPAENWKSAITLEHIANETRNLCMLFGKPTARFGGRYIGEDCDGYLVEIFNDTRTEAELEAHELKAAVETAIGAFSNLGTEGDLYTIVIQDQPSTDE